MKFKGMATVLVLLLMTLYGCSTTSDVVEYSAQQIEDGKKGSYELITLALKAATENTIDSIEAIEAPSLFTPSQYLLIELTIDKPGVQKRLDIFSKEIKKSIKQILLDSIQEHERWIAGIEIVDPYDYILGANNSLTKGSESYVTDVLSSYILDQLSLYPTVNNTYNKCAVLINTYILTSNENDPSTSSETLGMWEPSAIIENVLSSLIKHMERQEQIIRTLAPSYESEYIQLYNRQ